MILNLLNLNYSLAAFVLVAQLCLTLRSPMDCSPSGSSVHGILQARILEWVAISFSRGSSHPRGQTQVSCIFCNGRQIFFLPLLPSGKPVYVHGMALFHEFIQEPRLMDVYQITLGIVSFVVS